MRDTPRTEAESTLHPHGAPDPAWIAPNGACALCARKWAEGLQADLARLTEENEALRKVLGGIAKANRFDRQIFDDDTAFVDWAQSLARHAIKEGS